MCPKCRIEPLQYLFVVEDGRVFTFSPGPKLGTKNAMELDYYVDQRAEGIMPDRYGMTQNSEFVGGRNQSIKMSCGRCAYEKVIGLKTIEVVARTAASNQAELLTIDSHSELRGRLVEVGERWIR
jgi:hypothetical protein